MLKKTHVFGSSKRHKKKEIEYKVGKNEGAWAASSV